MKKTLFLTTLIVSLFLLSTQNSNAQLGFKKMKDDAVNGLKQKAKKKKDSMQNVLVLKLMDKTTSFCKPSKTEKVKITSSSKAHKAYSNMTKELNAIESKIAEGSTKGTLKNLKKLAEYLATIYVKEPNADLSNECDRLTTLQQAIVKKYKL